MQLLTLDDNLNPPVAGEGHVAVVELQALIDRIGVMLQEGDAGVVLDMPELVRGLVEQIEPQKLQRFQKKVDSYDFEEAEALLREIEAELG